MGTPVPLKIRERECLGADPRIHQRKLTEEEIARYHSPQRNGRTYDEQINGRSVEMKKQKVVERPSKEKLEEMCKQYPNQYRASYAIAEKLGVSHGTIDNWIKAYGITGIWEKRQDTVSKGKPEETTPAVNQESCIAASEAVTGASEMEVSGKTVQFAYIGEGLSSEPPVNGQQIPSPIQFEYKPDVEVQILGVEESTKEKAADEFILINKVYKFGAFGVDVQYDLNQVVICDPDNDGELAIPFDKLARIAGNLQKISTELTEREVM